MQFPVLPVAAPVHVIAEVTSSSVVLLSMAGELKLAEESNQQREGAGRFEISSNTAHPICLLEGLVVKYIKNLRFFITIDVFMGRQRRSHRIPHKPIRDGRESSSFKNKNAKELSDDDITVRQPN